MTSIVACIDGSPAQAAVYNAARASTGTALPCSC
ncbi:hypothetical protein Aerorivi_01131 [Aeromonas rivipollensis]